MTRSGTTRGYGHYYLDPSSPLLLWMRKMMKSSTILSTVLFAMVVATTTSATTTTSFLPQQQHLQQQSRQFQQQNSNLSRNSVSKLLRKGRLLDNNDNNEYDGAALEAALLGYSLKMVGCKSDVKIIDNDNDNNNKNGGGTTTQYGAVIFRLCPSNTCNDSFDDACSYGYADFAVGLNSFVYAFLQDQIEENGGADNVQEWDDDSFELENFSTCTEYNGNNNNGDDDDDMTHYIGPTCTDDGLGIKLAVFSDSSCYKQSSISFEDISSSSLPFSNGGLVSTYCTDCAQYDENYYEEQEEEGGEDYYDDDDDDDDDYYDNNDEDGNDDENGNDNDDGDNDEDGNDDNQRRRRQRQRRRRRMEQQQQQNGGELRDMCSTLYEEAPYKCETGWDVSHYYWDSVTEIYRYGQNELGCKFIHKIEYAGSRHTYTATEWTEVIFLLFLVVVSVAGVIGYTIWWSRQKENLELVDPEYSLDDEDEDDDIDDESSNNRGGYFLSF